MSIVNGVVYAPKVEVRFAYSGRVTSINKKIGEMVKKGETLAALDRKILQAHLDVELEDYERRRAIFETETGKIDVTSQTGKYQQTQEQALLNVSVKQVELAKAQLDLATLTSPVNGLVVSDGNCRVGLNVTPSANPFEILDLDNMVFRVTVDSIDEFIKSTKVVITINKKKYNGTTYLPIPTGKSFTVDVVLEKTDDLWPGITGNLEL